MNPKFSQPTAITADHQLDSFQCGETVLDEWLQRRAMKNDLLGASRTFVSCIDNQVVGYYALTTGSIAHKLVSGKMKRNLPDPIPAMVLGRLAIDQQWQGHGLGYSLLRDATLRCKAAAAHIGARAILVHALSDEARQFYKRFGFRSSPLEAYTLIMLFDEVKKSGT